LTKVKNQWTVNRELTKASTGRYLDSKKGKSMDIMVTAIVAVSVAIIAVLIAVIKRKTIGKIFIYTAIALIIGLPFGYFLAPIIISFF
jgi:preprotein translocase subunit Sec61beta